MPPEERDSIKARTASKVSVTETRALPDLADKALAEWLKVMNAKLDAVVNMLTFEREGFGAMPLGRINVSGGGIGFYSKEKFNSGDVVEIKTILPIMPPVALYLYGEVVKADLLTNNYAIAAKFVAMDEEVRDEVVKFVFSKQRELLREKRK